jgi:ABC-2 type transport system permease protein
MLNKGLQAVIKRELKEKIISKGFIIMTVLIPIFMIGILGFQTMMMNMDDDKHTSIEIVTESDSLTQLVKEEFDSLSFVKSGYYDFSYATMGENDFDEMLKVKKAMLLDESLTGIVFIPDSSLIDKSVKYYTKNLKNFTVLRKIEGPLNKVLISAYFSKRNLSDEELKYARSGLYIRELKVTREDKIEEEGYGNLIFSYLLSFLLYLSLLFMGSMAMQSVISEKNNRIVEVLLSSVTGTELMTGKILGSAIMGLLQMTIWMIPVMLVISTSVFILPPEFLLDINLLLIFYYLVNFFIGLVTFVALFTTVGSMFDNPQDAQAGMWPVMMLIMIPFFIAITMFKNPSNSVAEIASLLPFASIIVMPGRMTLIDVPIWQVILHFVVNIGTLILIFPFAGRIFRIGILKTGKKPSIKEIIKWLKYS